MSAKNSDFRDSDSPSGTVCWGRGYPQRWFKNKTLPLSIDPDVTQNLPRYRTSSQEDSDLGSTHDSSTNTNVKDPEQSYFDRNQNPREMNPDEDADFIHIVAFPKYDQAMAKQRASIKWLLSKAYNNQTPDDLAEPFYKDHQGDEHLKPFIVKGLSDAELYCRALCNLYADPNYSQLSPWGVVQAMARKGSYVQAPIDMTLTETVLIQNRPLRINAHMALIEAMMVLHVRELISPERVVSSVQRYGSQVHPREMPSDTEETFLLWINRAILAVKEYLQGSNQRKTGLTSLQLENWNNLSLFQDLSDLGDGVGLCALLSYYCPDEVDVSEVVVPNAGEPLNVSESLWNLQLLQRVCKESLPFNVFHFTFEDLLYFNESLKQNLFSFLADIFYLVELKPCSGVKPLGSSSAPAIFGRPDRPPFQSYSASSTPKKVANTGNTVQIHERKKSTTNIFLGDSTTSGRRSPSGSVVSIPVRRSQTPERYLEKAHSERGGRKEQNRYGGGNSSEDSEEFVVHRGRNVPTLSQVIRSVSPSSQEERSSPGSRMSNFRQDQYQLQSNEEEGGIPAAGRPSTLGANKTSYAGRRSRRNSFSEADSQLTVENFGGSQEKLNRFVMERNPDKQPAVVTDNTPSPVRYPKRNPSLEPEPNRNSCGDSPRQYTHSESSRHRSDYGADEDVADNLKERTTSFSDDGIMAEAPPPFWGRKKPATYPADAGSQPRHEMLAPQFRAPDHYGRPHENVTVYVVNDGSQDMPYRSTSLSNLSRLSDVPNKPVNIVYLQNNEGNPGHRNGYEESKQPSSNSYYSNPSLQRRSGEPYRPPPNHYPDPEQSQAEDFDTDDLASQLASIRLKLEEKRKRIEQEKGRMETIASRNQSKLGKAAYLKAINKGRDIIESSYSSCGGGGLSDSLSIGASRPQRDQLQLTDLESKWLQKPDEICRTPEIESMDTETYQRSLAKMDSHLSELESDIGRLSLQQEQFQRAKNTFFLHGDSSGSESVDGRQRKSDGNPSARSKWGPPRPTVPLNVVTDALKPVHNGDHTSLNGSGANGGSFRLHTNLDSPGNRLFNRNSGSEGSGSQERELGERPTPPPRQRAQVHHVPLPTPPPDDMEPQSVSFVQDENAPTDFPSLASSRKSVQITSGSKTYRITPESASPPRPSAHRYFKNENNDPEEPQAQGFYIALDEGPKGPKPPVRARRILDTSRGVQDLSSAYVASIVDNNDKRHNNAEQIDTNRMRSRIDGDNDALVVDQKHRMDSMESELMEKKKEKFLLQSLKRQQQVEEQRRKKEDALRHQKEEEAARVEEKERKKEEERIRKQAILESYRMKKQEDLQDTKGWEVQENAKKFMRPKSGPAGGSGKQRPKTVHLSEVDAAAVSVNMYGQRTTLKRSDSQTSASGFGRSAGKRGSSSTLYSGAPSGAESSQGRRDPWGSTSSLNQDNRRGFSSVKGYGMNTRSHSRPRDHSTSRLEVRSRRDSGNFLGSQDFLPRGSSTSSLLDGTDDSSSRCSASDTEKSTPVKAFKAPRPTTICFQTNTKLAPAPRPKTLISPKAATSSKPWPGSLPSGLVQRRRFDDGASDISSVISSNMDYSGLRLYKQPTAKSNRSIILNAVEYCVFPGAVNRESKQRVLDEINQTEAKHFLIMFRDAGCQFRAIYAYSPDTDEIVKLFGTGPRSVTDNMFDRFFKYNSGGKCFSQVHTKHLTVTIDAFTIHNSLWTGKKPPGPKTRDSTMVI